MRKIIKRQEPMEFSKKLLLQESMLIWVVTLSFIVLAFTCIANQYFGELPWITAMATAPWGAYAVGQSFYYRKAEKENTTGGIKYESVMATLKTNDDDPPLTSSEMSNNAQG